ncbi:MAG: Fic family protein [Sphingobacteriia bacterium]|nr:Fic family protein [Sphingobacteriia bacterium]
MKHLEHPPSLKELLRGNSERILELAVDDAINKIVNQVNDSYYYWDKVKYIKLPESIKPEEVWLIAKLRRRATPFRIDFGKFNFSWVLNGKTQELLHLFDLNIGGSLESRSIIPKDEKNRYLISSIMEEAIASSQIEGAVTTRKHAKEMLRRNTNPRNKSEQMILNNYLTIQRILELKDEDLTEERLLEIHRLVSRSTLDHKDEEGSFRDNNDIKVVDATDGEVVHYPPDHNEIKNLIKELCVFFNSDNKDLFIHPIIKGCIIHFMIGFIHPFSDGNGRTARALFYWYLLKKGYWLTEYLSISRLILRSKDQYAKAYQYTETDDNDLTYFIMYKLRTMKLAYESLREYIQRKIEEKHKVSEFIKLENVNERQALILKWFYEEPSLLLTVKEVETRFAVSNQTARTDLLSLVELKYIDMIQLNKKAVAFKAAKNFEVVLKEKLIANL